MGFVRAKRVWNVFADELVGVGSKRIGRRLLRSMLIGGGIVDLCHVVFNVMTRDGKQVKA